MSTLDRDRAAQGHIDTRPRIPLGPFGLSMSIFLAISFLLCSVADVIPWFQDVHLLKALYPDMDWSRPEMIAVGMVWASLSGWYVAVGFGSLYNFFVARVR